MLSIVNSCTLQGLQGFILRIEVDVSGGLPAFDIVGLPDVSIRESKERVRAAIKNSGFEFPLRRITVNLAPADLKKEGPLYDLPIAAGILAATEQIPTENLNEFVLLGELSLDGAVRPVSGVLPMVAAVKRVSPESQFILPIGNALEGALAEPAQVLAVPTLRDLVCFARKETSLESISANGNFFRASEPPTGPDMSDVLGQQTAKRALEVAASGGHNIILIGPPGSGKTMLARRLPSILPSMTLEECLQTSEIYSVAGLLPKEKPLIKRRPFRTPHHTASAASIIGGGKNPRPGEISLAHNGVLLLDELPEYSRLVLEALRQPLEERQVVISRVLASHSYPADFMLAATMNPCPCGYYGDTRKQCNCTPHQIQRYQSKISGPLLDRIDIHMEVPRLEYKEATGNKPGEKSEVIRKRVERAREKQRARFQGLNIKCNAEMNAKLTKQFCSLEKEVQNLVEKAFHQLGLSMRAFDRILKVSRTIADLEDSQDIRSNHIAEALQYRALDQRKF